MGKYMIDFKFNLKNSFNDFLKTGMEYLDPKWTKFKKTLQPQLEEKEEELSTKGFIKKYGVDEDDYVNLRFAKKESLKNVSPWRWTDPRLQNALRQLSSKTTNPQFVRMLQGQMTPVASLKTRGPRAKLQSTKTKFG